MATVVLIGTLDTKGREYAFVHDCLRAAGVEPFVVDVGVLGEPALQPDVAAADVARLGGDELEALRFAREGTDTRAHALAVMGRGAAAVVRRLRDEGRCDGVLGLAGSGGSAVIAEAMRALPVGVPKLLVSTMVATSASDYVGTTDLALLSPVTDIAGLNRVSRAILSNAAHAIAGMASAPRPTAARDKPLIALTMMGVTTPCVLRVQQGLEELGFETIVFHAVGAGGRAMEEMVSEGQIDAVCDITTHEVTDHELGGIFDAGPERLVVAGRRGIPLVAAPGALEFVNFGPRDSVPHYLDVPGRRIVIHNPSVCAVRVDRDEATRVGEAFATRVNAASGPASVLLPLRGCSNYEVADGPFVDPDGDAALFDAIRATLRPHIQLREVDANINDPEFADAVIDAFDSVWAARLRHAPS
jgi:uncharacterized protein (UPF0261 family)